MLRFGLLLLFFSIFVSSYSQNTLQDFEPLNIDKVKSDIDTIKQQIDSTFFYVKETYYILKEEVKLFGMKKTLQINFDIFKPIILFIGLYIVWLIKRK